MVSTGEPVCDRVGLPEGKVVGVLEAVDAEEGIAVVLDPGPGEKVSSAGLPPPPG